MPLAAREAAAAWNLTVRGTHATGGEIWGNHPHVTYYNTNTTTAYANGDVWLQPNTTTASTIAYTWNVMQTYHQHWEDQDVRDRERYRQGGVIDEGVVDPVVAELLRESRRERTAERQRVLDERVRREDEAKRRAAETLRDFLGEARYDYWARRRLLVVRGSEGGIFVLRPGTVTNVTQIRENRMTVRRLCAHPRLDVRDESGRYLGELPIDDVIIGQVLALTSDEREFCRIANVTNVGRDDVPGIGMLEWREWLAIENRDIIEPQAVNDEGTPDGELAATG